MFQGVTKLDEAEFQQPHANHIKRLAAREISENSLVTI